MGMKLTHDYVQLEQMEKPLRNGLYIPDNAASPDPLCYARVLACGPGASYPVGCTVRAHAGSGIRSDGDWFVFDERKDIVAVVETPDEAELIRRSGEHEALA